MSYPRQSYENEFNQQILHYNKLPEIQQQLPSYNPVNQSINLANQITPVVSKYHRPLTRTISNQLKTAVGSAISSVFIKKVDKQTE